MEDKGKERMEKKKKGKRKEEKEGRLLFRLPYLPKEGEQFKDE